jgi:hypothetical protein
VRPRASTDVNARKKVHCYSNIMYEITQVTLHKTVVSSK